MTHNSRGSTWRHLLVLLALVFALCLSAGSAFAAKLGETTPGLAKKFRLLPVLASQATFPGSRGAQCANG